MSFGSQSFASNSFVSTSQSITSVIADLQLLFSIRGQVNRTLTIAWNQRASVINDLTLLWRMGDPVLTPVDIIKIRPETRVFRALIH